MVNYRKHKKLLKVVCKYILILFVVIFLLPEKLLIPVVGADYQNWDRNSYWFYPWGKSITHKGIDIFSIKKTPIISPTYGIIIETNESNDGGNYICLLGPKWRVHYFAHLDTIFIKEYTFVNRGDTIGTVGNTGNAWEKEPHLHYSIMSIIPYPWLYDEFAKQGWKKMFYLNPADCFK